MKRIKKGKLLLAILILVAIIAAIVILIVSLINKKPETPETPEDVSPIIELPDTKYSDMEVKNIHMEYLKENDQTAVRFDIVNTTSAKVENQLFTSVLIGPKDEVLAEMPFTHIQDLDVGQTHALEVIFEGDVTATKQIKLIKK